MEPFMTKSWLGSSSAQLKHVQASYVDTSLKATPHLLGKRHCCGNQKFRVLIFQHDIPSIHGALSFQRTNGFCSGREHRVGVLSSVFTKTNVTLKAAQNDNAGAPCVRASKNSIFSQSRGLKWCFLKNLATTLSFGIRICFTSKSCPNIGTTLERQRSHLILWTSCAANTLTSSDCPPSEGGTECILLQKWLTVTFVPQTLKLPRVVRPS